MSLSTILEDVLPTKWSSYIAVLTVPLAIGASRLPLFWPLSRLVTTTTEIQLFQVLLSVLTALIGTLCCLVLVVIDYQRKNKEHKVYEQLPHDNSLNEDFRAAFIEKILELNNRIETLENPNQYLHGLDALNKELKKIINHTNKK